MTYVIDLLSDPTSPALIPAFMFLVCQQQSSTHRAAPPPPPPLLPAGWGWGETPAHRPLLPKAQRGWWGAQAFPAARGRAGDPKADPTCYPLSYNDVATILRNITKMLSYTSAGPKSNTRSHGAKLKGVSRIPFFSGVKSISLPSPASRGHPRFLTHGLLPSSKPATLQLSELQVPTPSD